MRTKNEPSKKYAGRGFPGRLGGVFLLLSTGFLAACSSTSYKSAALAPPPPRDYPVIIERVNAYAPTPTTLSQIETVSGPVSALDNKAVLSLERQAAKKGCRVKDRFDRKYLLAYQWGRAGESRIGLDVDGIGFDGGEFEGVMLEYKLRLQPIPNKKEACRDTQLQGLIGTGYHELFVREDDTVWQHLDEFQDDWSDRLDTLFDD